MAEEQEEDITCKFLYEKQGGGVLVERSYEILFVPHWCRKRHSTKQVLLLLSL